MFTKVQSKIIHSIPASHWVLVVSDIHLAAQTTSASRAVEHTLSKVVEEKSAKGGGTIVLNGDIIELWAGERPSSKKALQAHAKFAKTLRDFASTKGNAVFFVVGNHDSKIGWDKQEQKAVRELLGAQICFLLELKSPKGSVHFEHGHNFDPDNAISDPRDPHDTPLGQHIVTQALPLVKQTQGKLLDGIDHLTEPHLFAKFVASRVMYRQVFNRFWWLAVPLAATLVLRIIFELGVYRLGGLDVARIASIILITELVVFINAAILLLVFILIFRGVVRRAKALPGHGSGSHHNDAARNAATHYIRAKDLGLITGHTHRPEVCKILTGFYANSGCGTKMISASKARFGLPSTYIAKDQMSWLELTFASTLEVRLFAGTTVVDEQTRLEKFFTRNRNLRSKPVVCVAVEHIEL